jgi:hypothetical protein
MTVKYVFCGSRFAMPVKSFKSQKKSCANFQGNPGKEITRALALTQLTPCFVKQFSDEQICLTPR